MEKKVPDENFLWVTSLVSQKDQQGYVEIEYKGEKIQLSVAEAREHALYILEACEAAEMDAILLQFLQHDMGLEVEKAIAIIQSIRQYRIGNRKDVKSV
jgi:hypothetical protein